MSRLSLQVDRETTTGESLNFLNHAHVEQFTQEERESMKQEKIRRAKPVEFVGTFKEWRRTPAYKVLQAQYDKTPQAKAVRARYAKTSQGKAYRARHAKTPQGKEVQAKGRAKYAAKMRATALSILGGRCVWTGTTTDLHLDHIHPLYRRRNTGYASNGFHLNRWVVQHPIEARERLQLLCSAANRFKSNRNNDEARAAWFNLQRQALLELEAA